MDEVFVKEKINPIVGFIFHSARQLGIDNAPNSMDMEYLEKGTEKIKALLDGWTEMRAIEDVPSEVGSYLLKKRLIVPDQWMADYYEAKTLDDNDLSYLTNHNKQVMVDEYSHWKRIHPPAVKENTDAN